MQKFLAFIRHFRVFLLFVLLQGISFYLYFSYISFPRSQYLTTAGKIQGEILKKRDKITQHFDLVYNNKNLQKENIRLKERLPQNYIQLERSKVKINDTLFRRQYTYIPAKVINSTYHKRNNYFTLDIGNNIGVKRGMGVVSPKGIIGIIHNSSDYFSVVKSCLTEKLNVAIMLEKTGEFGFLEWDGRNPRYGIMSGVSNDYKIKKGAKIITRGGDGIFPRGISVGKVIKTEVIEGKPLWKIIFKFSEDFRNVQNVYVIQNELLKEQKQLEETVNE